MKNLSIVYFGTPEFSSDILEHLIATGHCIKAVVTLPDKPSGRGLKSQPSAVKKTAIAHHLPLLQPSNLKDSSFTEQLKLLKADIFIVIAFRILPQTIWEIPPYGTYNVHASLLPKYRGAAPVQHALLNDEKITGVTLFRIDTNMDTGSILASKEVPIDEEDNFGSLQTKLKTAAKDLLAQQLHILARHTPESVVYLLRRQEEHLVSYAPKIKKEDLKINWQHPARRIYCQIRAFSPYPGAECFWQKKQNEVLKIKIFSSRIHSGISEKMQPGKGISVNKKNLLVGCGDGKALEIQELQPEGRKKMKIHDFLNGCPEVGEWLFA